MARSSKPGSCPYCCAVDRPPVDPGPAPLAPDWLDDLPRQARSAVVVHGPAPAGHGRLAGLRRRRPGPAGPQAPAAGRAPRGGVRGPARHRGGQRRGAGADPGLAGRPSRPPGPWRPAPRPGRPDRVGRRAAPAGPGRAAGAGGPVPAPARRGPLPAGSGLAVLPVALAAEREAGSVGRCHPRPGATTTRPSSRPRWTPSSSGCAPIARWCGATCPSTTTTSCSAPNPTSPRTRSPPTCPGSTRSGCAASARPWCACPRRAPRCSPSRPSSARSRVLAQRREVAWALAVKLRALEPELTAAGRDRPVPALAHPLAPRPHADGRRR